MKKEVFLIGDKEVSYIISPDVLIRNEQDALDIIGNLTTNFLILHDHNFERDFFDLSTRKLGEILQKLTNYHFCLAVIGDFEKYPSKTLKEFTGESNRRGRYLFVKSLDDVKRIWSK